MVNKLGWNPWEKEAEGGVQEKTMQGWFYRVQLRCKWWKRDWEPLRNTELRKALPKLRCSMLCALAAVVTAPAVCLVLPQQCFFRQCGWGRRKKHHLKNDLFPYMCFDHRQSSEEKLSFSEAIFFFFFFSLPVFVAAPESCHALASLILIPWQFICQSLPLDLQYDCFHPSLLFCPSIIDYKSPGNVELCFFFLKQNLKEFIVLYYLRMYFCHFCFFLLLCEWPHNRNKNLTDEEKWNNQASNCHQIM